MLLIMSGTWALMTTIGKLIEIKSNERNNSDIQG
jgi:hypothetical protein